MNAVTPWLPPIGTRPRRERRPRGAARDYAVPMAHMKLVCPSDDGRVMAVPENDGFLPSAGIRDLLDRSGHTYEEVHADALPDEARMDLYARDACGAANRRHPKVKVGRPFGSNKYPGSYFGLDVPGLLVYDADGTVVDVYPHEEPDGRIVRIREYLLGVASDAAAGS